MITSWSEIEALWSQAQKYARKDTGEQVEVLEVPDAFIVTLPSIRRKITRTEKHWRDVPTQVKQERVINNQVVTEVGTEVVKQLVEIQLDDWETVHDGGMVRGQKGDFIVKRADGWYHAAISRADYLNMGSTQILSGSHTKL